MTETYLVRAKLCGEFSKIPLGLPVKFGEFLLNYSPNSEIWSIEQGFNGPNSDNNVLHEDDDYPISPLYVETEIKIDKRQPPLSVADETLEQLEAMLRLFKTGDIYLRRHKVWYLEGKITHLYNISTRLPLPQVKAEPTALYNRDNYELDDETLSKFIEFFNSYFGIIKQKSKPLWHALFRFSSSYEKRTLADRLVELMIAMEALFGDNAELTYKISLRSACMLYPAGEAREKAFNTIRKLYEERSKIVHGKTLNSSSDNKRISQFEDYVRNSIFKFLQLYGDGHLSTSSTLSGEELDRLIFFTKENS